MYQALHATSQTLAGYLEDQIKADTFLFGAGRPFKDRGMHVLLNTPQEMVENNHEGISLWLYRVVPDEMRRNDPAQRISPTQLKPPPLPLLSVPPIPGVSLAGRGGCGLISQAPTPTAKAASDSQTRNRRGLIRANS